tara:strand:- start:1275 stop:2213 length:939 start_codon:yes stop_codon:yes gene_type:complete
MKILVTGGCGYVGTVLIKKLLKKNYKVISIDTKWFGDYLPKHKNLKNIKKNILDIKDKDLKDVDIIIHLASIANDPMSLLDKNLSWEVSCLGTYNLMRYATKNKVKKVIYASSSSVYGIKKEKKVSENLLLKPISLYNKAKMITEKVVESFKDNIDYVIIRPATVCGFSPRMRYDVTVNALTLSALLNKKILVNGGSQIRPNIHIDDMVDLYLFLIENKGIKNETFNAGFENLSINKIAKLVAKKTKAKIFKNKNFDPRSYRVDSNKLLNTGFFPKKNISNAIDELIFKFNENNLKVEPNFFSVKWLKKIIV